MSHYEEITKFEQLTVLLAFFRIINGKKQICWKCYDNNLIILYAGQIQVKIKTGEIKSK